MAKTFWGIQKVLAVFKNREGIVPISKIIGENNVSIN